MPVFCCIFVLFEFNAANADDLDLVDIKCLSKESPKVTVEGKII